MGQISVMIADNDDDNRAAIIESLDSDPDLWVIATASNMRQVMVLARQLRPEIILLNTNLLSLKSTAKIRQLLSYCPSTRIIGLVPQHVCINAPVVNDWCACAMMHKNTSAAEMAGIIKLVRYGKDAATRKLQNLYGAGLLRNQSPAPAFHLLTEQEIEIIRLLNKSYTSAEIAATLRLTEQKADSCRHTIGDKLTMKKRITYT